MTSVNILSEARYWTRLPSSTEENVASPTNFGVVKAGAFLSMTDHLYGICQKELLKVLASQVTSDRGIADIERTTLFLPV